MHSYSDRNTNEEHDEFYLKKEGINVDAFKMISVLIEPYRVRFVLNLEYLLKYTGMTTRQYKERVSSCGVKSGIGAAYRIRNRSIQGFDMIHFAALSDVFKLSLDLLMNHVIEELVNDGELRLEDYGVYRNKFRNKTTRFSSIETMPIRPQSKTVTKKLLNPRVDQSNSPCGLFNILQFAKSK